MLIAKSPIAADIKIIMAETKAVRRVCNFINQQQSENQRHELS
jgi:hypothetical protein